MEYRNEQVINWLISCQRTRKGVDLKNNKTGVSGVHRRIRNGNRIYVATWYDENNRLQRGCNFLRTNGVLNRPFL